MKERRLFWCLFVFLFVSTSCSTIKNSPKKTIVLSVYQSQNTYKNWISKENKKKIHVVEAISCSNLDSLLLVADGIILTGGEDINPNLYGHPEYIDICGKINHKRDTIERKLFDFALKKKIPLLGICRGMQMTNVALGGTLIPDIPTYIGKEVSHRGSGKTEHLVNIKNKENRLFPAAKDSFTVNSNHHQCIDKLAKGLTIIAKSKDGVIEAVSYDKFLHTYLVAVQFHPERMKGSAISKLIKQQFIKALD